jgi:PHD/YefM family antitoxin component YafN of YafNO toxin-antitoxin module
MINITEDIHSLTDFKKNTNEFIHDLKKSGRPTILTINGKAELVVMDAAAFHKMQEQRELEESIVAVNRSLKDFEEGRYSSAEDMFKRLNKRAAELTKKNKKMTKLKNK